jgi:hypothetical protein
MHYGQQTLQQLRQRTQLIESQVREALLVGLQHNFVIVNPEPLKTASTVQIYYAILIDNVLIRIRFPRFALHAKHTFGDRVQLPLLIH